MHKNKLNCIFSIFTFIYAVFALYFVIPYGSFMFDEGSYLGLSWLMRQGVDLYSGIGFPYGPLLPKIYEIIYWVMGDVQLIYGRLLGMLIIVFSGYVCFSIAKRFSSNHMISLLAPSLLYLTVGIFQSCRLSASLLAGMFSLIILYLHLSDIRRPNPAKFALIGVMFGLSVLTKHNITLFDISAHTLILCARTIIDRKNTKIIFALKRLFLSIGMMVATGTLMCVAFKLPLSIVYELGMKDQMNLTYATQARIPPPMPWNLFVGSIMSRIQTLTFYVPLMSIIFRTYALTEKETQLIFIKWVKIYA